MSYTTEEVDGLVGNLEKRIEKLQGTMNAAVKRNASERDVLAAAAEIRDLLKKAVADDKTHLSAIFSGEYERIGRIRYALDVVEFSHVHKKDPRWSDLNEACSVIEEVLEGLGVYKPWKPAPKIVREFDYETMKSVSPRTLDQQVIDSYYCNAVIVKPVIECEALSCAAEMIANPEIEDEVPAKPDIEGGALTFSAQPPLSPDSTPQEKMKPAIEGEALIFSAELPLSPGSVSDTTTGSMSEVCTAETPANSPEKTPETPTRMLTESARNDATTMTTPSLTIGTALSFPVLFGLSQEPAKGVAPSHHQVAEKPAVDAGIVGVSQLDADPGRKERRTRKSRLNRAVQPIGLAPDWDNGLLLDGGLDLDLLSLRTLACG